MHTLRMHTLRLTAYACIRSAYPSIFCDAMHANEHIAEALHIEYSSERQLEDATKRDHSLGTHARTHTHTHKRTTNARTHARRLSVCVSECDKERPPSRTRTHARTHARTTHARTLALSGFLARHFGSRQGCNTTSVCGLELLVYVALSY